MSHRFRRCILALTTLASTAALAAQTRPRETPLSMVNALHTAFGDHHARAVHTKGIILEGTFTPSADARSIVKEPIFTGGPLPIIARFSLFAGVPDLPDNDEGASPVGLGIKIKAPDGDDFDIQAFQHRDFIVATSDEFAVLLRAIGATPPDTPHPNPVEQFLATHPHAKEFLDSRTYPASYAQAKYFGINALKFTNRAGRSVFVRYQFVPHAGEHYLTPNERKAESGSYLQDEITRRVGQGPVLFDWYAQIAEASDRIGDPSTAWPDTRRLVKLGTFSITGLPVNSAALDKTLLFIPGQTHPGVEAADPMLTLRNTADTISFGERQ